MKKVHRPQLIIDTQKINEGELYDNFIEETSKYSITPTTFKSRDLQKLEAPIFQELYNFKNSTVNRFGLNVKSSQLLKEISEYNDKEIEKVKTPSIATTVKEKDIKTVFQDINLYVEKSAKGLTEAEKFIVNEAITYLQSQKKTLQVNEVKTVLIDVFERDSSNKIQIKSDVLQTHTVVLYEQEDKYLVIDPSNTEFSTILVGAHEKIKVCFNKKIQLYKPDGDIGSTPEKWRDCIDIAVKLAFNLEKNSQKIELERIEGFEYINSNSLKDNFSIQEVTNNPDIYRKIPYEIKHCSFRVKQSSNIIEQKKITEVLKTFGYLSTKVTKLIDEIGLNYMDKKIQQEKEKIFNKSYSPAEYELCIGSLQNYCTELAKTDEVSLLASSMESINENFEDI